jgi:conjugative relaxase-like TrwC/TraI family protein
LAVGSDIGYLTGAVAGGRENYYTGAVSAGEPPGRWYGAAAESLGLTGDVDHDVMSAVYEHLLDPSDPNTDSPATWGLAETLGSPHKTYKSADTVYAELIEADPDAGPERREELQLRAERSARQATMFIDATFSAPKSVSIFGAACERQANDAREAGDLVGAAQWDARTRAVEDAVRAGAKAAVEYLQDAAGYSRVGHHGGGAGRWVDAHQWVVAGFLQHDSRDRDPQLHVHQAILNRALGADGQWRALDSRAIHRHRGAAGAIAERVMEATLTESLGVRFNTRPDGKARELVGVTEAQRDLFSSRRRAIGVKAEALIAQFTQRKGREPSALERTQISQQATLATRAAKSHVGETDGQRLDRWEREARTTMLGGLGAAADAVLAAGQSETARWSPTDVLDTALATVAEAKQAWTRSDLMRAISDALPGQLGLPPDRMRTLLERLTDTGLERAVRLTPTTDTTNLPDALRLADGRSAYDAPGAVLYAAHGQLAAERQLRDDASRADLTAFTTAEADRVVARFAQSGVQLGADQLAALRGVLTSGAAIEVLSAAAGSGKSFTVGALADAWRDDTFAPDRPGRRVFGLTTSQAAAAVLTDEGLTSRNLASWIGSQRRIDAGRPQASDEGLELRRGDLVVIDEAAMSDTSHVAEVHRRAQNAGAKLLLVGDQRQLAAVGAGGAMGDLTSYARRYELTEVRRFTARWEAAASLRLRDGDPTAVAEYAKHGRVVDAGTTEQAELKACRAWLADHLAGRDTVLLVGSNDSASRCAAMLRAELVALGQVEPTGVALDRDGTVAGVGDLVAARRNGWELIGAVHGNTAAPINRHTYRVTEIRADGGLVVAPVSRDDNGAEVLGDRLTLPREYVAADVSLAYASTVHAAQGRTVDTAHAVLGAGTDAAGAYVALSRGRDGNTAWMVTRQIDEDAPTGQTLSTTARGASAVLADLIESGHDELSALAEREQAEQDAGSVRTAVDRLADGVVLATAGRVGRWLDQHVTAGTLPAEHRQALAADQAMDGLERLLRAAELAGHDPATVLNTALDGRGLDGARSPAQVLHSRIRTQLAGHLTPNVTSASDLIPADAPAQWRDHLQQLAEDADQRRRELGTELAEDPPAWALDALGPVPDDPMGRLEWESRAGWAGSYRELADHSHETDALGSPPPAGLAETRAVWRAAHDALRLPETGAAEAEASDGLLRARVRAAEREENWAPEYVAEELEAAAADLRDRQADAVIWAARADVTDNPDEATRLRADAAAADQQAETLAAQVAELEQIDQARAQWYAHTAPTTDMADRARGEAQRRGLDLDAPDDRVTAEEWLAAHDEAMLDEDPHREITEADVVVDEAEAAVGEAHSSPELDTAVADIRDRPGIGDTVEQAAQAVAEIAAREGTDEAEEQRRRDQWHADDTAQQAQADLADDDAAVDERV